MKDMQVLIDTNIIVDTIQERQPYSSNSKQVLALCIANKIDGYITAHSLCDLFYILRKDMNESERLSIINHLCKYLTVISEFQADFINVTNNRKTTDLEDGLQMICAEKYHLDYIITRNVKDFTHSHVPAILPQDFLEIIDKT